MIKRLKINGDGVSSDEDRTGFKNVWVLKTGKTKTTLCQKVQEWLPVPVPRGIL
jgi:hypothetical protein